MPSKKHKKNLITYNLNSDSDIHSLSSNQPEPQSTLLNEGTIILHNQSRITSQLATNIFNHENIQSIQSRLEVSELKQTFASNLVDRVDSNQYNKFTSKSRPNINLHWSFKKVQDKKVDDALEIQPVKKERIICRGNRCSWEDEINPKRSYQRQNTSIVQKQQIKKKISKGYIQTIQEKQESREEIFYKREQGRINVYKNEMMGHYKRYLRRQQVQTSESDHNDCLMSDQESQQVDRLSEIEQKYLLLDFKLANNFQKVVRGSFERPGDLLYSTHFEYSRARKYTPPVEKVKQIEWISLDHLRILNINMDLNIPSRGTDVDYQEELAENSELKGYKRKNKVYYGGVTDEERAEHFMEIIRDAMIQGVDFILIQQGYQFISRRLLLDLINQLSNSQLFAQYSYPQNLDDYQYNRSTLILSKHPVRFGQLRFEMTDHKNQDPKKYYFPLQAFCEFQIMIENKIQSIAIFNCHLRSNGQKKSRTQPWKMRLKQLDCIYDWATRKKYDRLFIIGDTNMPSGQKFKSQNLQVDTKFFDAFDQGFTPIGGTYLYRNERNQIVDERMDRVLMNKGCEKKTVVQIQYQDVLLNSCIGKRLDKWKMLAKYEDQLTYITLSDHKLMNITIYMTKNK